MGSIQIFGTGFAIMLVCIGIGIILAFSGGTVIDSLTMGSTGQLIMNNTQVSPGFQNAQNTTVWFFINLYYFMCYAVPILGIGIFIQSILPKTSGDRYI
jgi:hypothetical protein